MPLLREGNWHQLLKSVQLKLKPWRNNSTTDQFNSLWVMPTTYVWASVSLLFHRQKQQNSQFAMETICVEQRRSTQQHRASRRKSTGVFLHDGAAATVRWGFVLDSNPKMNREHKSLKGGFAWARRIRAPLWRSTAWFGQLSPEVPWHFQTNASANQAFSSPLIHSSAAALRQWKKGANMFLMTAPPHLQHHKNNPLPLSMFNYRTSPHHSVPPQGDTTLLKRSETRRGANEDSYTPVRLTQWCRINPVSEVNIHWSACIIWPACETLSTCNVGVACLRVKQWSWLFKYLNLASILSTI